MNPLAAGLMAGRSGQGLASGQNPILGTSRAPRRPRSLAPCELHQVGEDHRREGVEFVVVARHGVVVELPRVGDACFGRRSASSPAGPGSSGSPRIGVGLGRARQLAERTGECRRRPPGHGGRRRHGHRRVAGVDDGVEGRRRLVGRVGLHRLDQVGDEVDPRVTGRRSATRRSPPGSLAYQPVVRADHDDHDECGDVTRTIRSRRSSLRFSGAAFRVMPGGLLGRTTHRPTECLTLGRRTAPGAFPASSIMRRRTSRSAAMRS